MLNLDGYQETNQIYAGTRTLVYRAIRMTDRQPVIIKVLRNPHPNLNELVKFRNQYLITRHLDSRHIERPLTLERYSNGYALVMPDSEAIALSDYWQHSKPNLTEFLSIAIQLTEALHYLTQQRIIHKDIKPANIIIHPKTRQVKLIDFSISSLLPKEQQQLINPNVLEGTLAYISPEQTGRMNRGIDYRTDFYSLGVTFYELLTGELPFPSDDPMELVHCHIAQPPIFPHTPDPIPQTVLNIVLKLMAKNAEDRYQSALGLKHDLEQCQQQWQTTGEIAPFPLRKRDLSDRFVIPEQLYGREAEVQQLLNAFDRVALGHAEMMIVAGFSGIGKTAVVHEIHKPITRQRGYFIAGKFDQFQRHIPFSGFVQALRGLIAQLLSESDAQLAQWHTQMLQALGDKGQVLMELIPELERIIGPQPPAPELSGIAAQNRFHLLFQNFIGMFTTAAHPLVIFLDDLQWADLASLQLLELLMAQQSHGHLLLLGAYRDNEVSPTHPLMLSLEKLITTGAIVNLITLQPLKHSHINQMVADTLNCELDQAQQLTELVYQKTLGNPFFTTQLLKGLHQEGSISFDYSMGVWQCELSQVRRLCVTEDVVAYMATQLQKLPTKTQTALKLAACIGGEFELGTLALVWEQSQIETADALWSALQAGLIFPSAQTYKFFHSDDAAVPRQEISVPYKFLHDRVQQAAYSLIPEAEKQKTHLQIGRSLTQSIPEKEQAEHIFDIVNQLNIGRTLIHDNRERTQLAQLNLIAGNKAKASTAYTAALEYSITGLELLGEDSWLAQYQLTLELHQLAAESAYLSGDFEQMQQLTEIILNYAKTLLDTVPVYEIQITACIVRGQPREGIKIARSILQKLSITFPATPTPTEVQEGLEQVVKHLHGKSIPDLVHLPTMVDPEKIAAMKILMRMIPAAFQSDPVMVSLITFKMVKLSIQHGNTAVSAYGYSLYGLLLCGAFDDINAGSKFGKLALSLLSKFNAPQLKAKILTVVNAHVAHWQQHIKETLSPALEGYATGLETGDLEYAGYCAYIYPVHSFWLGKELEFLEKDLAVYCDSLSKIKQQVALNWNRIYQQTTLNLQKKSEYLYDLIGTAYDERQMLPMHEAANDLYTINHLFINKLLLCYLCDRHDLALNHAQRAEQSLGGVTGLVVVPLFYFYDALVRLALYSEVQPTQQQEFLAKVAANQKKIESWANYAPMNHLHKLNLIEAEKHRVLGEKNAAIDVYDLAISGAKKNGYIQEEALGNELAAKFYLDWGKAKVAAGYMQEAYYCYIRWGAKAKTEQLEEKYPQLLTPILPQQGVEMNIMNIESLDQTLVSSTYSKSRSTRISDTLDFASLFQAAQTLSSTIDLDRLLTDISRIILTNAGAQKTVLLIPQTDQWQLRAIAQLTTDGTVESSTFCQPLTPDSPVPIRAIQYVKNTHETLLIDEATTQMSNLFEGCKHRPQSVLCQPLLNQGNLIAIVYLEHSTTKSVFTPHRQSIVKFLCTQAAISLHNAQLYDQAQQALRDLKQAQLQIVQSEKMSTLGNLVAGVAHEINNPTGFLQGNIQPAQNYAQDLLGLIELLLAKCSDNDPQIEAEIAAIDLEFIRQDLPKLLDSMNLGIERIRDISNSLRTFSRQDREHKTPFNIHHGIDSTLLILKHRTKPTQERSAIEIVKDYGDIPKVQCFPGQLNQVFMNILANAIDAFDEANKGKTYQEIEANPNMITIHTLMVKNQVHIQIQDNGCGMTPQTQVRIFEQGFTTKEVGKGTGFGMAIAHQIITEKHGGAIVCDSILGKGTIFTIILPI